MMEYWDHWCSIWLKNNTVHGKKVKIDPNNLDQNTEVMRF